MRDLYSNVENEVAFNTTNITSDSTPNGNIIDLQGFASIVFVLQSGLITDGAYTPELYEGNEANLSDAQLVQSNHLIGSYSNAAFVASDDNLSKKLGYIGDKRYLRLDIRAQLIITGGTISALAVKGNALLAPTS